MCCAYAAIERLLEFEVLVEQIDKVALGRTDVP